MKTKIQQRFTRKSTAKTSDSSSVSRRNAKTETRYVENERKTESTTQGADENAVTSELGAKGTGNLKFTQTTASPNFSKEGKFAGKTIGEISGMIRNGQIKVKDVPVVYIERNGVKLIENTRSSLALKRAGIAESDWNLAIKLETQ